MEIGHPLERTLTHHDHARLQRLLAQQPAPAGARILALLFQPEVHGDLAA